MSSLEEFEKQLADQKKAKESKYRLDKLDGDSGHHKHRHHHRHCHQRHNDHRSSRKSEERYENDSYSHRSKRTKYLDDGNEEDCSRQTNKKILHSDVNQPIKQEGEKHINVGSQLKRDAWMQAPSAIDFDYRLPMTKGSANVLIEKPEFNLKIHKNELNSYIHAQDANEKTLNHNELLSEEVAYNFGDAGSQWRMTKLKAVYNQANQSGKTLVEVATNIYGDLKLFDHAREEKNELERQKIYGDGYVGKQKPTGELFQQRKVEVAKDEEDATPQGENKGPNPMQQPTSGNPDTSSLTNLDATALNRMKAQLMKARLRKSPDVAKLQKEYDDAMSTYTQNFSKADVIVLDHMENRMLTGTRAEVKPVLGKRGRERGLVECNEDMTIDDMVREERRTRGQGGGEGMRAAERIAKDASYETDIDYIEENAHKLAKRVQKSEINLRNIAIGEYQKMNRILDNCQLCHHEDKNQQPIAPIVSLATRVFLTLPTEPELIEGGAVIVPIQHRLNLLECDDDEWEEIRNFMKSLIRMYHEQGRDVMFYENAADLTRKRHAAMQVVPLPYSLGEIAPAFFKEAILSCDEEWAQHKKLLDTAARARDGLGKHAFRRTFAKEMPYFHAWFEINGGLGHIVEDTRRWPKGDLFAREVIGGMLDIDSGTIRKQGRWNRIDKRLTAFKSRWLKFDWTRILTDG